MQYTYIIRLFKTTSFKWSVYIKIFIFILIGIFLWKTISIQAIPVALNVIESVFANTASMITLCFAILLLPFNWLMEALKWHHLVRKSEPSSVLSSYIGILTGITLGFLTPHGVGDYFGRIFQLKGKERQNCLGYVLLTRMTQLQATLFFGGIALVYYLFITSHHPYIIGGAAFFALLANLFFLIVLFINKKVIKSIKNIKLLLPIHENLIALKKINRTDMIKILFYSVIRYCIFALQFYLLLYYFHVSGSGLHLAMGIAFVFLAKSIFPTFFELGVREAAALFFYSSLGNNEGVLSASLSLWLINIVLPALIGFLLLPRVKLVLS